MPIDWKSPEAYQRLLAAIMAAQDGMKVCVFFDSRCDLVVAMCGSVRCWVFLLVSRLEGSIYGFGRGPRSGSILMLACARFRSILI